ncbi:AAA family ATPase [Falsiroseomonas sp.]|uniref:AAA family ATPase n=1 Tax=Falsiroseomonas sp. TaxID=2870721 RepID=UPI0027158895|nr:AAA family ATPase [Falsiroseomonas sp.]MDO9500269.1 AAA family ATPase [Falsiroseomonas sp.]
MPDGTLNPEQRLAAAGVVRRPVKAKAQAAPATPFRVMLLSDCASAKPAPAIVKGLIRKRDHVVIVGQPGAGKSVVAPLLGHHMATGRSVFGRRVRRVPVIYVAAEDGVGMILRGAAMLKAYGDTPDFHLIPTGIDLATPDPVPEGTAPGDHDPMPRDAKALRDLAESLKAGAIFIDTLAAAFPGLQENESAAMDHVVRVVRYLAESGAAVILLHHTTKSGSPTPRGHGRLDGDADVTLFVEVQEGTATRTVRLGKNRAGSAMDRFAFTIRGEVLGLDDDRDEVTAPVAIEEEHAGTRGPAPKAESGATLVLRELHNLAAGEAGEMARPEPRMPVVRVVPRDVLRAALVRSGWFPEPHILATPPAPSLAAPLAAPRTLTDAGYQRENKALNTLKAKGLIGFNRQQVWCTR